MTTTITGSTALDALVAALDAASLPAERRTAPLRVSRMPWRRSSDGRAC